jgi:hypothetical protein
MPNLALRVGTSEGSAAIQTAFREFATLATFIHIPELMSLEEALIRAGQDSCTELLLLLCEGSSDATEVTQHLKNAIDGLKSARKKAHIVIEVNREIKCAGVAVHTWVTRPSVARFLTDVPCEDSEAPSGKIRVDYLTNLIHEGVFAPSTHRRPAGQGEKIFISTPYFDRRPDRNQTNRLYRDSWVLKDFLQLLKFDSRLEEERINGDLVPNKVMESVGRCDLMIANVGLCEAENSKRNAHVYMEIGAAICSKRRLLLIRPSSDRDDKLPEMVKNIEVIDYDSAPDLIWQFYHRVDLIGRQIP